MSRIGWLAVVGLLALGSAACGGEEKDVYELYVPFLSRSGDLPIESGAPVRVDGEEVGEVAAIEEIDESERIGPPPHGTHMTMLRIEDEQAAPLPRDCAFGIESGGVEISRGHTSSKFRDGDIVDVKQTRVVP